MRKDQVRSIGDALAYMTDCTLATVCDMATKKRRPKYEYERQILIAQTGYNWMVNFGVLPESTLAKDVEACGGSVAAWAKTYEVETGQSAKG